MKIRQALPSDYSDIESLWIELNMHHVKLEPELIKEVKTYLPRAEYLKILEDPKQDLLIVEEDGLILGAAWLAERIHEGGQAILMPVAFVQEICVTENSRGQGLGRKLMTNIEDWASKRGLKQVEFNIWSQNQSALAFYEELGFRFTRHEMSKPVA